MTTSVGGRHVVLVNPELSGVQYGMQRDFETEICRIAGAEPVVVPPCPLPGLVRRYTAPGTRYAPLANLLPKAEFPVSADVLWVVLMGPEDFPLWFYKGWDRHVGKKILYLYDTFEGQIPTLRRVLARTNWDLAITSFPDAAPLLERETGRRWHAVLQGICTDRFLALPESETPAIAFSSYGRRLPAAHKAVRTFTGRCALHYDYTVTTGMQAGLDSRENYQIYAWHLRQSWFNFNWPVDLTNPARAQSLSPITCRWFECAAAGTVMVGGEPKDPAFKQIFSPGFVIPFDAAASEEKMIQRLSELWADRHALRAERLRARQNHLAEWTWEARVREILKLLG